MCSPDLCACNSVTGFPPFGTWITMHHQSITLIFKSSVKILSGLLFVPKIFNLLFTCLWLTNCCKLDCTCFSNNYSLANFCFRGLQQMFVHHILFPSPTTPNQRLIYRTMHFRSTDYLLLFKQTKRHFCIFHISVYFAQITKWEENRGNYIDIFYI